MYAFDYAQDYCASLIAAPPGPPTTGLSLTVTTGEGSLFPDPALVGPYTCVICAPGVQPTLANAEEVRVTAKAGDVFTLGARAQGPTAARAVVAGDRFYLGAIAKYMLDLQALTTALTPGGRLTLTSAVPVTTADVLAAPTLFYTAYGLGQIALYNGARWVTVTFSEISIAVPAVAAQMFDVYVYDNGGVPALELLAWAADLTPPARARQDGIYCKGGALSRRFVGSFRTTVAGQTEESVAKRLVSNYYNRAPRVLRVNEATDTWNYNSTAWRQANGSAANQVALVLCAAEETVDVTVIAAVSNNGGAVCYHGVAIGKDSINTAAVPWSLVSTPGPLNDIVGMMARCIDTPAAGYHFYAWLEVANAVPTSTWYGDNAGGSVGPASGIFATVRG